MKLIEIEIARQFPPGLRCGCGGAAEHLIPVLRGFARTPVRWGGEDAALSDHVLVSGFVLSGPAPQVVAVSMAALADDIPLGARESFAWVLQSLLLSDTQSNEAVADGRDLFEECEQVALQGLELLYAEILRRRSATMSLLLFPVADLLDTDRDRLRRTVEAVPELKAEYMNVWRPYDTD